jgi:hypothetical protein
MWWIVLPVILLGGLLSGNFNLIWTVAGGLFFVLGKILSLVIGIVAACIGISLCLSIIGAFFGVPLLIIGGGLMAACMKR